MAEAQELIDLSQRTAALSNTLWRRNKNSLSAELREKGDSQSPNNPHFALPDPNATDEEKAVLNISKRQEIILHHITRNRILRESGSNLVSSNATIDKHIERGVNENKDLSAHADNIAISEARCKGLRDEIQSRGVSLTDDLSALLMEMPEYSSFDAE